MPTQKTRKSTRLKLSQVKRIVAELVNPIVERVPIALTKRFRERQKERKVDLFDVDLALRKGKVVKEYLPDSEHPEVRWAIRYKKVSIVFNFNEGMKALLLITCWRQK